LLGLKNQQEYSNLEGGHIPFTDEIIKIICGSFEISPEEFTSAGPNVYFDNSPYAHSQNSGNNHNNNNDISIINDLLKAKNEELRLKDEAFKAQEELIKVKDQLIKTQEELIKEKDRLLKNQG